MLLQDLAEDSPHRVSEWQHDLLIVPEDPDRKSNRNRKTVRYQKTLFVPHFIISTALEYTSAKLLSVVGVRDLSVANIGTTNKPVYPRSPPW